MVVPFTPKTELSQSGGSLDPHDANVENKLECAFGIMFLPFSLDETEKEKV
jgi:hypothetical protein